MKYALTISMAMRKVTLVATATALVVAPVFAQESKMTLGDGEAVLVGPDGTMHKSKPPFRTRITGLPSRRAPMKSRTVRRSIGTAENSTT